MELGVICLEESSNDQLLDTDDIHPHKKCDFKEHFECSDNVLNNDILTVKQCTIEVILDFILCFTFCYIDYLFSYAKLILEIF